MNYKVLTWQLQYMAAIHKGKIVNIMVRRIKMPAGLICYFWPLYTIMYFFKHCFSVGIFAIILLLVNSKLQAQCTSTVSTFPYVEDFETSNGGWTSGGTNNDWAWGVPAKPTINTAGSGSKCWVTGTLTGSFYQYSELSYLQSPCFDFSTLQHPFIAFLMYRESEWKFDGGNLQYSTDMGSTWTNVGTVGDATDCMDANWYNHSPVTYLNAPLVTVKDGWCGNHEANSTQGGVTCQGGNGSLGWIQAKHCLQNLAGKPSVMFRFTFGAGTTCNDYDGLAFDSIAISEAPANSGSFTYTCINNRSVKFTGTAGMPCSDTFKWNFGDTGSGANDSANTATPTHTFSGPGTYTITLTISGGPCNAPSTVTKTIDILNISPTTQSVSCFGGNNGAINLTTTGGTGTYTYNWAGGINTQNRSGLSAGTYTVTVSDLSSCPTTLSVAVNQPPVLAVTATPTGAGCNGGSNGAVTTSVTGGTSLYSYNWGSGITTPNRTGLSAGTYTVTVTDAHNCTATASAVVTQAAALTATATTTNSTCTGNTGSVILTVSNGNAPYTYAWSNGATTQNLSNVGGNTYTVTITDAGGCTGTASFLVNENGAPALTATPVQISCHDANDGQINVTLTGGNPAFTYTWSNTQTTQNIANLAAGTYVLTVTDAQSCSATAMATIVNPNAITITLTPQNEACFGNTNASITSAIAGGTPAYTYLWSTTATTAGINNLSTGNYSLTVNDQNMCSASASVTITQPQLLTASAIAGNVSCFGQGNGTVTLTVNGGTNPDSYLWSNGATTQNLSQVGGNTYSVVVTDTNGCTASASATVSEPQAITITGTATPAQCFGYTNGSVNQTSTGGASGFVYTWSNGASSQNLTGIANGTYKLTVTDASGCTATASFTVTSPAAIVIDTLVTNVSCFGNNDGSITATASGGSGSGYGYAWSNASTSGSLTNLAPGTYQLTVTDGNNCSAGTSINISEPANLTATLSAVPQACVNLLNGSASATVNGGTTPYSYHWSNQGNSSSINNLGAGTYTVTVTDTHNCTYTGSVNVDLAAQLGYISSLTEPFCWPLADGAVSIDSTTGGTPPYTYTWNNQQGSSALSNLTAGTYYLVITDSRGCTAQDSFTLQYQYSISVAAGPSVSIELGDSTELTSTSSATNNVTYNWTPPQGLECITCQNTNAQPVRTTLYYVTATDSNGCYASDSVLVTVVPNYNLFIPNAFTPNGDGNNDLFQVFGNKRAIIFWQIEVFNRWGEKVFQSNDINFGWDGTYKGVLQNPGVFVYEAQVVFADDHTRNNIKGSLTLLR